MREIDVTDCAVLRRAVRRGRRGRGSDDGEFEPRVLCRTECRHTGRVNHRGTRRELCQQFSQCFRRLSVVDRACHGAGTQNSEVGDRVPQGIGHQENYTIARSNAPVGQSLRYAERVIVEFDESESLVAVP